MVPAYVQLVEENLPPISYQEQRPEHSEIRSIEALNVSKEESNEKPLNMNLVQAPNSLRINSMDMNTQDSYSEEIQAVSEKSKNTEPIGQNMEKVRFYQKKIKEKKIITKKFYLKKIVYKYVLHQIES